MFKMAVFNFLWVQNGRNILKFTHCVFPIRLPRSVLIKVGTFALIEIFLQFLWHLKHTLQFLVNFYSFFAGRFDSQMFFACVSEMAIARNVVRRFCNLNLELEKKSNSNILGTLQGFFFNLILHEKRGLGLKSRIFSFFKSGQF